MTVLLTGATGFVGGELLVRLMEETDHDVLALVRADDDAAAQARLDDALGVLLPPGAVAPGRVRAVAAHLDRPGLGLPERQRDALARDVRAVAHCAASVSFTLPLEEAEAINVGGTREVLALAARAPALERFVHVSTAYVAGDRAGRYREDEFDLGQASRNTYEHTKLAAELEVRAAGLPGTVIARPSIVVGDSRTGWTPAFNVIYWPLQAFARGLFPLVPGDPEARVDIVPVDTVADALLDLLDGPPQDGAVHLVAGDEAMTAGTLATLAGSAFEKPLPRFVAAGEAPDAERSAGAFLPYFRVRGVFDAARGHRLGFRPPPLEGYFSTLMDYARATRWGKRPRARWELQPRAVDRGLVGA
jgi:thioester reductase-like protein